MTPDDMTPDDNGQGPERPGPQEPFEVLGPPDAKRDPAGAFVGVGGWWRQWTGLGLAGVLAGLLTWVVTVSIPAAYTTGHRQALELHQLTREDGAATRQVLDRLATAIEQWTEEQRRERLRRIRLEREEAERRSAGAQN